jgi:hypothetical protein
MTRSNFLLGVAVSLVVPLACLMSGLAMSQPLEEPAVARRGGGQDMERVQKRFVELLKRKRAPAGDSASLRPANG